MKIFDFPLAFYPPRATLIAAEKHLKYERVTLNIFTADNMRPEFLKISRAGTLPVLVDGDTTLTNSRQIVEYLDNKDGKPLGSPAVARAIVTSWMDKLDQWDGNLFATANASPGVKSILDSASWYKEKAIASYSAKNPELKEVYAERLAAMKKSATEAADLSAVNNNTELLKDLLRQAEDQLEKQPYLAGSEYSTADVLFIPVLFRLYNLSKAEEFLKDKPKVKAYYKKIQERPGFKEAYGPAGSPLTAMQLIGGSLARITLARMTGL